MEKEFEIKPYTKKELALMYFPHSMPRTAVNHLMQWVRMNPPLREALGQAHYRPANKTLSKPQVKAIVHFLGEP